MRFTIYAGDEIIYDPYLASSGYAAISPTLTVELNKSGSLEFVLPPGSTGYDSITKLKTIIRVYRDDTLLFKGRVINDERDFYNRKRVYCEGALSFFIDSQMRPYHYNSSVASFLNTVIENHNSHVDNDKKFTVGTVSVTDPIGPRTRESSEYRSTLDVLNNELVEVFGGFLRVRESQGENVIDYIGEYGTTSSQTIEFGKNLLDLTEHISAEGIYTVLIPLGEEIKNNDGEVTGRLTIAEVNSNKDYLEDAAGVNLFGRIEAVSIWDEVSNPSLLKTLGQNLLANGIESSVKLTIKAIDYRMISQTEASFELGEMVRVISEPHNINTEFQVTKITYDISNPDQTTYEFGADYHTLTERTVSASKENKDMEGKITKSFNDVLNEAKDNATALINNGIGGHVYVLPDELYIMDEESIDDATKVWRWNLGGLGYWSGQAGQARSGQYGLAITQDGAIVADYITAGTLNAGVIKAGLLKAYNNEDNWWNLSTGELHISGDSISIHAGDNIAQYLESTTSTLNLLPSAYYSELARDNPYTYRGITWTTNTDGSVTATGTATGGDSAYYFTDNITSSTYVPVLRMDPSKKHTLSGCPSGGGNSSYRLRALLFTSSQTPGTDTAYPQSDYGDGVTIPAGYRYAYLYALIASGTELPAGGITFYPMFEVGSTKHAYQSSHTGSGALVNQRISLAETAITQNAEQIRLRATKLEAETYAAEAATPLNLLPNLYWTELAYSNPHASNGITWTLNADGSVTATGTATGTSEYYFTDDVIDSDKVPVLTIDTTKKHALSGCPSGGSTTGYRLLARLFTSSQTPGTDTPTWQSDLGDGVIIPAGYKYAYLTARIESGTALPSGGIKFYPMFEVGSTKHEYQSTHNGSGTLLSRLMRAETTITQTSEEINLKATKTEAQSYANAVANEIGLRNLLPSMYYSELARDNPYEYRGITWTTNSDGSVTAKGTATGGASGYYFTDNVVASTYVPVLRVDSTKQYTLSGCPSGGSTTTYYLRAIMFTSSETPGTSNGHEYDDYGTGITIPTGYTYAYLSVIIADNAALPSAGKKFYPMFEAGSTKHVYQSTHDGTGNLISRVVDAEASISVKADRVELNAAKTTIETNAKNYTDGQLVNYSTTEQMQSAINVAANAITSTVSSTYIEKTDAPSLNLLPSSYYSELNRTNPYEYRGITWTLNADGSVTAKGTATGDSAYYFTDNIIASSIVPVLRIDSTKKHTLSGCPSGGGANSYRLRSILFTSSETPGTSDGHSQSDYGDGVIIPKGYKYAYLYALVSSGTQLPSAGIRFYPMFEAGSIKHEYQSTHNGTGALYTRIKSAESSITQTETAIESKVSYEDFKGETIVSKINQTASTVTIDAAHINLTGKNIDLTAGAGITISSTNFTVTKDGDVTAWSIHVKGTNAAPSDIAGWTVTSNTIKKLVTLSGSQYEIGLWAPTSPSASSQAFYVQNKTSDTYPFQVTYEGKLKATGVEVSGNITAESGRIAGSLVTSGINASNITAGTLSASRIDATNLHVQGANIDNLTVGKINGATAYANSASSYLQIGSWQAYGPAGSITFGQLNTTNWVRFVPNGKLVYEYGHSGSAAYGHTAYMLTYDGTYYRGLCDSGTFYRLAIDW